MQKVDLKNARHKAALDEQAKALEGICSRRLSVLTGGAGTGKLQLSADSSDATHYKRRACCIWLRREKPECVCREPPMVRP